MKSYSLKYQKNTENTNTAVLKISNGKLMILSRCDIYDIKKIY